MTRWLIGLCAVAAAAGVLVRYHGRPGPDGAGPERRAGAGARPPAPPAPVESAEARAMRERLLRDDTLAPPPADASPETRFAYEQTVRAIGQGNDPLMQQALTSDELRQKAGEMQKRMQERRETARRRLEEERKKKLQEREQRRREAEAKRLERHDPPRPPPQRIVAPLDLGPAVLNDDGTPMDLGSPPPPPAPPE